MSKLPSSMSLERFKKTDTMHIDTQIIDPATITNNSARFVLQRKGILNTGSSIQVGVIIDKATADYFLPIKTGIHGLIKQATLRIGTNIVAQTDENGFYQTAVRQFKTNEQKTRIDTVTKGTSDGMIPDARGDGGSPEHRHQYNPAVVDWTDEARTVGEFPQVVKPTNNEDTTALFSIKLSELFPHMMRDFAMPLFVISEPVSIDIVFNTQEGTGQAGRIVCYNQTVATPPVVAPAVVAIVSKKNCKMIVDYLTYSDDMTNEVLAAVMSKDGLVIPYSDLILSTSTIPALSGAAPAAGSFEEQKMVTEVGFSGKTIKNLIWLDTLDVGNAGAPQPHPLDACVEGVYTSQAYMKADSYQVRVNDMNVYNRPIENEAMKQNEVAKVMGNDICVLGGEYSMDYITDKSTFEENNPIMANITIEGHAGTSSVAGGIKRIPYDGQQHIYGVDLVTNPNTRKGTLISQKPILLERTLPRTTHDATQRTVRCYGEYERTMILQNGNVSVSA